MTLAVGCAKVAHPRKPFIASGTVRVVDPAGKPIADADVYAITASMDSGPYLTNKDGEVVIDLHIAVQPTLWAWAGKDGYEPSDQIRIPESWPLRITLQPKK